MCIVLEVCSAFAIEVGCVECFSAGFVSGGSVEVGMLEVIFNCTTQYYCLVLKMGEACVRHPEGTVGVVGFIVHATSVRLICTYSSTHFRLPGSCIELAGLRGSPLIKGVQAGSASCVLRASFLGLKSMSVCAALLLYDNMWSSWDMAAVHV